MPPNTISATKAKLQFGAMMAKVKEGHPIIIEKNDIPEIVWISIDDYEDFLELKDKHFQGDIEKSHAAMKKGKYGVLDTLYTIHRKTIAREAQ